MRRTRGMKALVLLLALSMVVFMATVQGSTIPGEEKIDVLIGFHGKPDSGLVRQFRGEVSTEFTIVNVIAARIPQAAMEGLAKNPAIRYIEPNFAVYANAQETPWGIDRVFGNETYSFRTWDATKGDGLKVAVLDTGIERAHVDLSVAGGTNTIDTTDWGVDGNGHGTHVAGTIAALDNDWGVVGIGPEIALYAVKVLSQSSGGTVESVVAGIQWAVEMEIPVLNMSLGSSSHSVTLQEACDAAYTKGHLLVASAGNNGNPAGKGDNVGYPAAYSSVVAVAASNNMDARASFSSTGPAVELMAPGVNVKSTWKDNSYYIASGTSMAAPHVTAAAVLTWAVNPGLTNVQVRQILQDTAQDLRLASTQQGYGLVRVDLAVARALEGMPPQDQGSIAGFVTDANGSGIISATVQVTETGRSVLTGTDGSYRMDDIPAGQWNVAVSADGYVSLTKAVTVEKDTESILDFQLAATPEYTGSDMHVAGISFTEKRFGLKFIDLTVLVQVVSSEDGLPLAEARMEMTLTYEGVIWHFT
ncbi:MAG: S8 family serine peptidase, partial [Clostridia bacterium]